MGPFFIYFGGKYRAAPTYPDPRHDIIIEPFAGSAGYSLRHPKKKVILVEKSPVVCSVWRFLIAATPSDILEMPLMEMDQKTTDLDIPQVQRDLIGFWINKGHDSPRKSPSAWMRAGIRPNSFWGEAVRQRLAERVHLIKHWELLEGDYTTAPDLEATWFVDPPYQVAGREYVHGSKYLDFEKLGTWCRERRGQAIVCENEGADWLDFRPHRSIQAMAGRGRVGVSREVVWTKDEEN